MSDFSNLLAAGFTEMAAQMTDATGQPIEIRYAGKAARVIPGSEQQVRVLRDTGLWKSGMVVVEMLRLEVARLKLEDRCVVSYGAEQRAMKLMTVGHDESDPCQLLTLQPHNG